MKSSPFTFEFYQRWTENTANKSLVLEDQIVNYALGIAGEAGEVANKIKKATFHEHGIDKMREQILEEVGDVLWYAARIAAVLDASLADVAISNIEKLAKRYPNGFSTEASINRIDT